MTNKFKSQITADAAGRKRGTVPAEGSASYKVGIDIGSTTIKVVVLDAEEHIVYKHCSCPSCRKSSRRPRR